MFIQTMERRAEFNLFPENAQKWTQAIYMPDFDCYNITIRGDQVAACLDGAIVIADTPLSVKDLHLIWNICGNIQYHFNELFAAGVITRPGGDMSVNHIVNQLADGAECADLPF